MSDKLHDIPAICDEVRALREENERLRKALRVLQYESCCVQEHTLEDCDCGCPAIGRAAIADKEGE